MSKLDFSDRQLLNERYVNVSKFLIKYAIISPDLDPEQALEKALNDYACKRAKKDFSTKSSIAYGLDWVVACSLLIFAFKKGFLPKSALAVGAVFPSIARNIPLTINILGMAGFALKFARNLVMLPASIPNLFVGCTILTFFKGPFSHAIRLKEGEEIEEIKNSLSDKHKDSYIGFYKECQQHFKRSAACYEQLQPTVKHIVEYRLDSALSFADTYHQDKDTIEKLPEAYRHPSRATLNNFMIILYENLSHFSREESEIGNRVSSMNTFKSSRIEQKYENRGIIEKLGTFFQKQEEYVSSYRAGKVQKLQKAVKQESEMYKER